MIRLKDRVTLDFTSLGTIKSKTELFLHYPGHLTRSFDSPSWSSPYSNDIKGHEITLRLSQTTVIKKRGTKNYPCNKMISDYDQYFLEVVINSTKCVYPFWRHIIKTSTNFGYCTSPDQLKEVFRMKENHQSTMKYHQPPCLDMFNTVIFGSQVRGICETCVDIEIGYDDRYYAEILQLQDFGAQDFISNLGGFIGIFLGYSMMQIPDLLGAYGLNN